MFKYYSFLFISFLFFSCGARLNYLGSSSAPTKNVDVFVDAASIKRPYTIVGKGYMDGITLSKSAIERMQKKALQKAREKGADAILFQDFYITENGTSVNSVSKSDSVGKSLVTIQSGRLSPVVTSKTDILFLKYN